MALIKYTGNKEIQKDVLYDSFTAWNGNGDIQNVTDDLASKLLKHPDVFEPATEDDLDSLKKEREASIADQDIESTGSDDDTEVPSDQDARLNDIVKSIKDLDEDDESLWGKGTGKPHVQAIERALGYDISAAERDAACTAIDAEDAE